MRLRPSGRAGPLANSLEGFESYHAQSAWTWEHMALTRARVIHGPAGAGRAPGRHRQEHALPAARSAGAGARRRRHARPHRPPCAAEKPVGLQAPAGRPVRHRLRGAVPGAAPRRPSDPTCSIRIPPRCCAAPPTPASSTATDAERLRAARTLLSDVQGLLRLTLNGDEAAFDEASAPEGQRRLIAVTEDADDLAELQARIAAETAAARAIYRRIVEQPARDAGWQPRTDDRRSDA